MTGSTRRELRGGLTHHVLNLIAAVLVFVGLFVCVRGAVLALGEINALYQDASTDALATPAVSEEARSERIFSHAVGALLGIVPLAAGSVLFGISRLTRNRKKAVAFGDPGMSRE